MSEEDADARNGEAKFASPDGDDVGIGYYFDGEPVSAREFEMLVSEKADRMRAEREAVARIGREGAEKGVGQA